MLGLSNNIVHGSGILHPILVFDFTFDFTSSASVLWEKFASPSSGFQGDMTIELGQNAPGESTNDWMKCTYDSDQTALTGIKVPDISVTGFSGGKKNDRAVVTYKLYLDGDWDGSDSVDYWVDEVYNKNIDASANVNLSQDTILDITKSSLELNLTVAPFDNWDNIGTTQEIIMGNGHHSFASDRPNAGAVFYIKDYNIQIYR
tara:strand:+ start:1168 stop:1776 length:609 start_codon:yes stop_codon:yes gene_type:complete